MEGSIPSSPGIFYKDKNKFVLNTTSNEAAMISFRTFQGKCVNKGV